MDARIVQPSIFLERNGCYILGQNDRAGQWTLDEEVRHDE